MSYKCTLRSCAIGMCTLVMLLVTHTTLIAQSPSSVFVQSIDWSADGTRIAISSREALTIYDMAFNPLVSLPFPIDINFDLQSATFSPDGTRLLMGNQILDSTTLQTALTIVDYILPYSGQWSPDGTEIAFSGADDRELRIYSALDGRLLRTFTSIEWVAGAEFGPYWSPDGRYFVTRAGRDEIYVMDARQGTRIARYQVNATDILPAVWSPDSTRIALEAYTDVPVGSPGSSPTPGSTTRATRYSTIILEVSTGRTVIEIFGRAARIIWNPDGTQIVGFQGENLNLWDVNTGVLLGSYPFPPSRNGAVEYSLYGGRILMATIPRNEAPASLQSVSEPIVPSRTLPAMQQTGEGGLITILIPDPSPGRLASIAAACNAPPALLVNAERDAPQALINQITALPPDAIPPACRADLLAVAEALQAEQSQ